jgi:hypothetical protein
MRGRSVGRSEGCPKSVNIFTSCELYVERQNLERFSMLSECDFKIRELMQKGAAPRSHEPGKKHFTDSPQANN